MFNALSTRPYTDAELRAFNLGNAIWLAGGRSLSAHGSLEGEMLASCSTLEGGTLTDRAFTLPLELLTAPLRRDMTVGGVSGSQYLVSTQNADPAEVLREAWLLGRLGATLITGQRGNLTIPEPAAATTTWLAEGAAATPADPTIGQTGFTPHTLVATINLTRQIDLQNPAVSPYLSRLLVNASMDALSVAALGGSGLVEPMGLASVPDVHDQSGASFDRADALAMQESVAEAGAQTATWVGGTATQKTLRGREGFTGAGPLWSDANTLVGAPVIASNAAPTDALFLGDWSRCVAVLWGAGVRVEVNPYQSWTTGGWSMRALLLCDVAFLSRSAFARATSVT